MFDFSDQVVIVTGAAGNLGSAVGQAFQIAGARLALVDHAEGRLQKIFPELEGAPTHFLANSVDLTDAQSTARMVAEIKERLGHVDVLVNAVGGYRGGNALPETSLETWEEMMNLNARAYFLICREVIPLMLQQQSGKIIGVAGAAGLAGGANMAAYSAAKSAVIRLTESMAAELKGSGINVNCILPGTIDTPQNRQAMPKADFKRWISPHALAQVILFLASELARPLHGAAIPAYGRD